METWQTLQHLSGLLRLETDSAAICEKTRESLVSPALRDLVASLAEHHREHTATLRSLVERLGGTPPADARITPPLSEALSAPNADLSEETRVAVCLKWEEHTAHAYEKALAAHHPPNVRAVLHGHRAETADHITALQSILAAERRGGKAA